MPTVTLPENFETSKTNSEKSSATEYSQRSTLSESDTLDIRKLTAAAAIPPITPKTDFAIRQANNLVEKICKDHGVEARKFSFDRCLSGHEDQLSVVSASKHTSVLRLAEYLHKRGQIERDYATSIQKLNRSLVQTGDTDERLGQMIVMGEKTAAGHMDWARKIGEHRIIDDLKVLCAENEEQRRYLMSEMRKSRMTWSKAVGAFEKVRKNRDKALKAADSAQVALDSVITRGNVNKSTLSRMQEDARQKSERAQAARAEYNRALSGLTNLQNELFKGQIPLCMDGFEKMERSRIATVRNSLINLAQVHLAVSDIEIESGQRWLKSLVSLSIDDEIEMFIESVEERSVGGTRRILQDEFDFEEEEEISITPSKSISASSDNTGLYGGTNLTDSESDLLQISSSMTTEDDSNDLPVLKERKVKLEELQFKLGQQLEALEKMKAAYEQEGDFGNREIIEAVNTSINGISKEISDNLMIIKKLDEKISLIQPEDGTELKGYHNGHYVNSNDRYLMNPMESILEEMNKLDQLKVPARKIILTNDLQPVVSEQKQPAERHQTGKKKSLSRSFEDILSNGDDVGFTEENASPKATGLKLPGAQWTAETISKSNEEIGGDYFCAEDEEINEVILARNTRIEASSPRRKSLSQTTPATSAITTISAPEDPDHPEESSHNLVPQKRKELFRIQALYNFIGRKETDELDLRTGEILSVFDANGEWWEAENEAGVRGYIPFNYVIRI